MAQFPPPIHGLSKAVETLYCGLQTSEYGLEKIDITNNRKFVSTVMAILRSNADLFYFTNSQTIGGNLRDLIIFKLFQLKKKKVLVHLHGGYYRRLVDSDMGLLQRKANYQAISKADGAIVLGPSLKWIFSGMLSDEKIYIVPNCVDDDFMLSDSEFESKILSVKEEKIHHVLWLSNFIRSKGYDVVLKMAELEKNREKNGRKKRFHFDFAGKFFNEAEKTYFFSYVKNNGLDNIITYHGVVTGDEKKNLLKRSAVFVLPTRYPNEGQPISILEAMANGMIILTTPHAGIPDIVQDKVNGIMIKNNTVSSIEGVLDNLECVDYQRIAENNINAIKEKYTQEKYIENMKSVFESVLMK